MSLRLSLWANGRSRDRLETRLSTGWREHLQKDPMMTDAVMVIEIILGDGQRVHVSSRPMNFVDPDGGAVEVLPLLLEEPGIANDYDLTQSSGARSMSFAVPQDIADIQAIRRSGRPIATFAEAAVIAPGIAWDDRRVVMRGPIESVAFGRFREIGQGKDKQRQQLLELTMADPQGIGEQLFPPFAIRQDSFAEVLEQAAGQAYPYVFGTTVVQAIQVTSGTSPIFVVAYGHTHFVSAVWRGDSLATGDFTGFAGDDELQADAHGVPHIRILGDATAATPFTDSEQVFVELRPRPSAGASTGDDPALLDVIRDVLSLYDPDGLLLNEVLFGVAQQRLGTRQVAGFANVQTGVFEWITGTLLSGFPMVSMVWSQGRYGPVVTDFRQPPVMALEAGRDCDYAPDSEQETPATEITNQISIKGAFDARLDTYGVAASLDSGDSPALQVSGQSFGAREIAMDAPYIRSEADAIWVVDWAADHLSLPTYFLDYPCPAWLFLALRRADTITMVDPTRDYCGVTATVERIQYSRGLCMVGLRVWNNPYRGLPWPE